MAASHGDLLLVGPAPAELPLRSGEDRSAAYMVGLLHLVGMLVIDGMAQGLLFNCTHDTVLRFLPPYILTEKDVDRGIKILKKLFKRI